MTTFSRVSPGTYDATTDTYTSPSTSTIAGSAIQVRGDPVRYQALSLVLSEAPTLFFVPTDYNLRAFTSEFVMPGDTVEWNEQEFTVRDVIVTSAPDGFVVCSRIIVAK